MKSSLLPLTMLVTISAQASSEPDAETLFDMSLEQLMQITVTTASKRPQSYLETPRAVYVITREDILRSGVTTIPDALRMAPGVHVAQITAHRWAISIRGFQQEFAGKLLVLIDGRTLYTPTFSGVFWDSNDVVLDHVERIEIVRGPGSVVWGSNAMNGVINIITRNAADTQGGKLNIAAGNQDKLLTDVTFGDRSGNWAWRGYAKYFDRESTDRPGYSSPYVPGTSIHDGWSMNRIGMRADQQLDKRDISLSVNVYDGNIDDLADDVPMLNPARSEEFYSDGTTSGYDASLLWKLKADPHHEWQLRLFVDNNDRRDVNVDEQRSTYDVELQYILQWQNHKLIYGAGYRYYDSTTQPHNAVAFEPADSSINLGNLFFHDDWMFTDNWRLNYGLKIEHDDYTETSYQPAIGLAWQHQQSQVWMNVERAIRLNNRLERDIRANLQAIDADSYFAGQPEGFVQLTGQPDIKEESIVAYELGYRCLASNDFYWDIAGYYFEYDNLIFFESEQNIGSGFINGDGEFIIPVQINNTGEGNVSGMEMSFSWQPMNAWKLKGSFTYTRMDLQGDPITDKIEGQTPKRQFNLRSFYNLNEHWQIDSAVYYVDELPGFLASFKSYVRLDLRLGWIINRHSELVLDGQNLLDDRHREHNEKGYSTYSEVPRSYYLKWAYKF